MLHAVVDTNILIRALLKPDSSDGRVFQLFLDGKITLYFGKNTLNELVRVLSYPRIQKKYHITNLTLETFLRVINTYGKIITPKVKADLCRDKDDNEILSVALTIAGENPVYLITADKDLLVLRSKIKGVLILTAQEFLRRIIHLVY